MTQNGQPDNPRASRYILKDFVTGQLLYCIAPPGESQEEFHIFKKKDKKPPKLTIPAERAIRVSICFRTKIATPIFTSSLKP